VVAADEEAQPQRRQTEPPGADIDPGVPGGSSRWTRTSSMSRRRHSPAPSPRGCKLLHRAWLPNESPAASRLSSCAQSTYSYARAGCAASPVADAVLVGSDRKLKSMAGLSVRHAEPSSAPTDVKTQASLSPRRNQPWHSRRTGKSSD
jgi:hypothetical protein